jgi:hypothetical protein
MVFDDRLVRGLSAFAAIALQQQLPRTQRKPDTKVPVDTFVQLLRPLTSGSIRIAPDARWIELTRNVIEKENRQCVNL